MIWNLRGNTVENAIVLEALDRCDFDFSKLAPSLLREGKQSVNVEWADLSRYGASDSKGHDHIHDGEAVAHPIERMVDGRRRVLGLFYLPPYTKIVLDQSLVNNRTVAQEVFLAEGAHAVDYHYMTNEHRRLFTNSVHVQQLNEGASCADGQAFMLDGHVCSWFDVGPYDVWVGEAFMEGFIEATSDIPVTINLSHPVGPEDRAVIRRFLGIEEAPPVAPEPAPVPTPVPAPTPDLDEALEGALTRFLGTKNGDRSPLYLRTAARAWLQVR